MKLTVEQEDLSGALATVQRAVSPRSTLPVLTGILIQAEDGRIRLAATDLEAGIRTAAPASVETAGEVVLPARYLNEIVRRIPATRIELDVDSDRHVAVLRWGRSEFTIHGYAPDQFPDFPETAPEEALISVDQERLKRALRETLFAVSSDETRPVLTGVCLEFFPEGIRALSTDGFRVALSEQGESAGEPLARVIVPGRSLQELMRLLLPGGPPAQVAVVENQLLVLLSETRFTARLLEGVFPTVLDLLPKEYPVVLAAERAAFQESCERVGLVSEARDRGNSIRLTLQPEALELRANAPEVGTAFEVLPCSVNGLDDALDIAFNARYLIDGLRILEDETLAMQFSGPLSAARLLSVDEGRRFVYTVLPMRTA